MTKTYGGEDGGPVERFTNSQFLVLVNRVLAFLVAVVAVTVIPHPAHATPLYKYSFCSISNILSSWCQYEALKFVTFPTQVRIFEDWNLSWALLCRLWIRSERRQTFRPLGFHWLCPVLHVWAGIKHTWWALYFEVVIMPGKFICISILQKLMVKW